MKDSRISRLTRTSTEVHHWLRAGIVTITCCLTPPLRADGPLVIVGGGLEPDNEAVYREVASHRLDGKPICIIPSASSQPRRAARATKRNFERVLGAGITRPVYVSSQTADRRRIATRLETCGGFYFSGGDQSRIVDTFKPGNRATVADLAIRQLFDRGAIVAGSSAGAAMMSDPMIGRGRSDEAFDAGVAFSPDQPGVWLRSGMGFLPSTLVDQHCLARGRFGRLLVAVASRPELKWGLCIDEDTAISIQGGQARILGRSAVLALDLRHADRAAGGFRHGQVWLLGHGDQLDLDSGEGRPHDSKQTASLTGSDVVVPSRIWQGTQFHALLVRFSRSQHTLIRFGSGRSRIEIRKDKSFRARTATLAGSEPKTEWTELNLYAGPFDFDWLPNDEERHERQLTIKRGHHSRARETLLTETAE